MYKQQGACASQIFMTKIFLSDREGFFYHYLTNSKLVKNYEKNSSSCDISFHDEGTAHFNDLYLITWGT